jgi:hypothetical protein
VNLLVVSDCGASRNAKLLKTEAIHSIIGIYNPYLKLHIICPYEDGRIAEAKLIGF